MRKKMVFTLFVIMVSVFLFQFNAAAKEKKLGISKALDQTEGTFVAFFSTTDNTFWSAVPGTAEVVCSVPWVDFWELFHISIDPYSGKTLIKSDTTAFYLRVNQAAGNKIYADQKTSTMEARWIIKDGSIQSDFNKKFVMNQSSSLTASSDLPVYYNVFEVIPVAIQAVESTMYARPTYVNNQPVIKLDSSIPVKFYLLVDGNKTYIETAAWQYTYPINTDTPLTFAQTKINQNNYRYTVTEPTDENKYWTIKSDFNEKFVGWDTSGIYATCLWAKYQDTSTITTHFNIYKVN